MYANIIPFIRMPYGATSFTYSIPSNLEGSIYIGQIVQIPFRKKPSFGVVHSLSTTPPKTVPVDKIAAVAEPMEPTPSWTNHHIQLLSEFAERYHCSIPTLTKLFSPEIPRKKHLSQSNEPQIRRIPVILPEISLPSVKSENQTIVYHSFSEKKKLINTLVEKKKTLILSPQIINAEEIFASLVQPNEAKILWDSQSNKTNQWKIWQKIKTDATQVVIATRSGLFLPLQSIEQIIIDDSDSSDHKSWEASPHYDVREMAKMLSERMNIPLIQFSMAPRIANSSSWTVLPSNPAPIHSIIHTSASSPLHENIIDEVKTIHQNGKHCIFIHHSTYEANTLRCLDCKQQWICPNNHGSLHLADSGLTCSTCEHTIPTPSQCTSCNSYRIKAFGLGLEGLQEWMKSSYEDVFTVTAVTIDDLNLERPSFILMTPYLLKRLFYQVDPKSIGRIVYLNPENLLFLPDYRANEWFYQAIQWHRAVTHDYFDQPLTIQTSMKEDDGSFSTSIQGAIEVFRQQELASRKLLKYPPFSQLITITLKSPDIKHYGSVGAFTRELEKLVPYTVLGPFSRYRKKKIYAYSWQIKQTVKNDPTLDKTLKSLYSKAIIEINPEQVV